MGLSLAVLAAALVYLAGSSNTTKIHVTRTVITQASVTSPGTATTTAAPSATTPAATTPGATTPAATTPGATAPAAATPSASAPAAVGSVVLLPVTPLTSSIVNLNGRINPQGVPTTYQFMYGPTVSYGGLAPLSPTPLGAGTSAVRLAARIANLSPGTTYHYKLTASKAGRAISTADATFTTTR
jgi:hypothetical protein